MAPGKNKYASGLIKQREKHKLRVDIARASSSCLSLPQREWPMIEASNAAISEILFLSLHAVRWG